MKEELSGIGDMGFVSASLKATKTKENDNYRLLFKGIVLTVGLVAMAAIGYNAGMAAEQKRSESDRKQLASIEESFADAGNKPFTLFGQYRVWQANTAPDVCYSKAKR